LDITDRKKNEEALNENNARLDVAMQAAQMAWWEMDIATGNVIFGKRKSEMLGYPSEKFKHYSDFTALLLPDDYEKAMNAMRGHLEGKLDKYEVEYRILTSSNEYKWFYDIGSIVKKDPNGVPLIVTGLVLDISARVHAEKAIFEAERLSAIGEMSAAVAHDFNNLLTTVSGCAEWIRSDLKLPAEHRELAEMIFEAAQRGALLSGQLLTFSRKGVAKNGKTTVQFNRVVRDLYKMLGRVFPKNILIQTQLAEDLRQIKGSPDQLNQVLMNLAVNASHAMPNGGILKIETGNVRLDEAYCYLHPDVQPG